MVGPENKHCSSKVTRRVCWSSVLCELIFSHFLKITGQGHWALGYWRRRPCMMSARHCINECCSALFQLNLLLQGAVKAVYSDEKKTSSFHSEPHSSQQSAPVGKQPILRVQEFRRCEQSSVFHVSAVWPGRLTLFIGHS